MDDELIQKLKKDLRESGFRAEMEALRLLLDRDWKAQGGASYFDLDERISREYDMKAYRVCRAVVDEETVGRVFYFLTAEIKSDPKPWVVFKKQFQYDWELKDGWRNLAWVGNLPARSGNYIDAMSAGAISSELGWRGYSLREACKKPSKPSTWYSALTTACKAGQHVIDREADSAQQISPADMDHDFGDDSCRFVFVKPIVITGGILASAELSEGGGLEISEEQFASVEFDFRTEEYQRRTPYLADIVQLDSLDAYAARCEETCGAIAEEIEREIRAA